MKYREREELAKRVVQFYENRGGHNLQKTIKHFKEETISRQTVTNIITRFNERGNAEYLPNRGPVPKISTPEMCNAVRKSFPEGSSASVRFVAKKLGIPKSTVSDIKVKKWGIKARIKADAPKYIKDQEERAKIGCQNILRKAARKVIIMDDETYVPLDPSQVPGRKFYHCTNIANVPTSKKTKPKAKFTKRYLVWQALDGFGNISEPYISDGTMDQKTYLRECIQLRLIPFIDKHHDRKDVFFWPDMASCHYAGTVTRYLTGAGIAFPKRLENAPNVPQARKIERFWAICKEKYSKLKKQPKGLRGFKIMWKKISNEVAQTSGRKLMKSTKSLLKIVAQGGPLAAV